MIHAGAVVEKNIKNVIIQIKNLKSFSNNIDKIKSS